MRRATLPSLVFSIFLATGCGGGGGGGGGAPIPQDTGSTASTAPTPGAPTSATPAPTPPPSSGQTSGGSSAPPPPPLAVVRSLPTHNSTVSGGNRIEFVLNRDVVASSVRFDGSAPNRGTLRVFVGSSQSGQFRVFPGRVGAADNRIAYQSDDAFPAGADVIVALSNGIRGEAGGRLTTGSVSGNLSLRGSQPDIVFQVGFSIAAPPSSGGTRSSPPPSSSTPPSSGSTPPSGGTTTGSPEDLTAIFRPYSDTDIWHIDFDVFRRFAQDLANHGLASGNATVDRWARYLVIQRALSVTSQHYLRNANGSAAAGQAFRISVVSNQPPGRVRRDYSRQAVGGNPRQRGVLGVAAFDPGNRRREDNARPGDLGVFSNVISGRRSVLRNRLRSSDLPFVDGSYELGDGSATQDRRFRDVRTAINDYGRSIALIVAHEVGHSLGLDHVGGSSLNIMAPSASSQMMSSTDTRFGNTSRNRLSRNVGVTR